MAAEKNGQLSDKLVSEQESEMILSFIRMSEADQNYLLQTARTLLKYQNNHHPTSTKLVRTRKLAEKKNIRSAKM